MDLLNRKHTAQSVALATGATAKQISDWCTLGLIVGQREPLGKGRKREFSWFNVMEVAVATTIMEAMRMTQPGDAFRAAQRFSHTGDGGGEWVGDDAFSYNDHHRWPGMPFDYRVGDTFLCVFRDRSIVALVEDGNLPVSRLALQLGDANRPAPGLIVLNMTRIFFEVTQRMALKGREVLEEVYKESTR